MDRTLEDLHHRLHQLRVLETETDDPLAERLVRTLIVELEDLLTRRLVAAKKWPPLRGHFLLGFSLPSNGDA
jgi:hypothetical protein